MKTNVYIDGFNLYYGCLRDTPYRWLDLSALCEKALPEFQINRIRYFTSKVRATPKDPQKPVRQDILIRALLTIPNLSVHLGRFPRHPAWRPLLHPPPDGRNIVQIIDTKEKGSDVKLASYLLLDGFQQEYDAAIVVSNDSDLCEPIRIARCELALQVGVLFPCCRPNRMPSRHLKRIATFHRSICTNVLLACQFPPTLQDARGTIRKPDEW